MRRAFRCLETTRCGAGLLIIGFACALGLAFAQEDLQRLYQQALQAQAARDFKQAIRNYEQIVKLRPDMAEAHANLGSLYYQSGDDTKAMASLKTAVALKPELNGPYFILGALSFRARQYEDALRYLGRTERAEPTHPLVHLYLGFTHEARGAYQEAVAYFERALRHAESRVDAYYHLSKAYGDLSRKPLEALQARYPNSFYYHLARAHFHEAKGRWSEARSEYALALERKPEAEHIQGRLEWLAKTIDTGAALPPPRGTAEEDASDPLLLLYYPPSGPKLETLLATYREKARRLTTQPGSDRALFELVECYQRLAYFSSLWVVENDPGSFRVHQMRGQGLEAMGRVDEAIAEYRKAIESNPEILNVRFAIGNLFWVRNEFEKAIPELLAELRVNPSHAEARYEVAESYIQMNSFSEAKPHLARCLEIAPQMAVAHLAMERVLTHEGQLEKGMAHLRKAIEIDPSNPTPHYRLAQIYLKLKRAKEAKAALARFEELRGQDRK